MRQEDRPQWRPVAGSTARGVAGVGYGPVEAVLGRRLAEGLEDASTGLMPEQKLVVPVCPRRENGHLWRFDRERSMGDCQAEHSAC